MKTLGTTLLVLAAVLVVLGALTWPPGGLMFALPFFFLLPAAILGVLGGLFRVIAHYRERKAAARPTDTT